MNDLQEQQAGTESQASTEPTAAGMPIDDALRYATGLAEKLRQIHRDGSAYGKLDRKNIVWDNQSVTLLDAEPKGAYFAPEQVRGEAADARTDIFAFGAIVYELLSGRRAFPSDHPDELRREILESAPPEVESIPAGVASLLKGCLEKDRDLR